jgi:hypothetical protein
MVATSSSPRFMASSATSSFRMGMNSSRFTFGGPSKYCSLAVNTALVPRA